MSGIVMDYDGLTFNDDTPDGNGTLWYVDTLDGWDSAATRTSSSTPTTRHGVVLSRGLLDARAIVIGGVIKSPDLASHWAAYYGLDGKFNNLFTPKNLTVTEDIDRYVGAVRSGSVRKTLLGGCAFQWQVNLTCTDPLKYAATSVSHTIANGDSATLTNVGTFPTERIAITTGAGAVNVVNETVGGHGLVTDRDVDSGTVFDVFTRSIVDSSGNDAYTSLASVSEWFTLQPGDNTVTNNSDDDVTVVFYPAWL